MLLRKKLLFKQLISIVNKKQLVFYGIIEDFNKKRFLKEILVQYGIKVYLFKGLVLEKYLKNKFFGNIVLIVIENSKQLEKIQKNEFKGVFFFMKSIFGIFLDIKTQEIVWSEFKVININIKVLKFIFKFLFFKVWQHCNR